MPSDWGFRQESFSELMREASKADAFGELRAEAEGMRTCDCCGERTVPPGRDRGAFSHGLCDECIWRHNHPTEPSHVGESDAG